ncbi:hypothetical protein BOTBODRAFT_605886 [Botryobasidium botryosum FD-172 SS1]|uniref:DH domain-containing protein n=1 Tax=Botryobasidium botryosum (strain FD-172 SS1) TaxID=930990 RepID=A0A067MNT0_BOTB1|nr:hypothetical protein BOTBODRAFT_605886 [Botryobasidium botryosum FD-172 SS1]
MWALIHRCWDVNSHQRISASQLVIEMNGLYSSGGSSVLLLSPVRPESPAHSPTLTFGPATPLSGDFLFAGSPDEDTFTSPIPERFSYSSFASSDGIYSSPIGSSRLLPSGPSSVSATDLPRSSPSNNSIPPNSERRRSLTLNKVRSIRSIFGHTRSATEPPSSPPPQRAPSRASSYSSGSRPGTGKVAPVQILTTPMKVGSEIPAEWVGVSGMERLRQLTPRQVRRESALQHLIDKEKSFVAQDLDNVVTTRLRDQKSPISPAERAESFLRQVFQRRVAITDAHRGFLVELNDRQLEHNGLAQIGGICLNAIVKLAQLYPEFQESLYMSEGLIDHEAKQNPAFARFLDQEVSMARGSGPATLKNFLRLPLAHIREETELIQLILAETPRDHPDVQSLQKVAQTLVGVINTSQLREWQASAGIRAAAAHSMLWRDLIYKGVAHEALSVEEIARQSAIFDLIKLEMEYVHDLQLAHTLFIIPLRKAAPSTLTADLLQALEDDVFPLHEVAWDLHHSLLLSLHLLQRHEHPTIRSVSASLSDILILRRERYVTRYSTHLPRAITLLDEVEDTQAFRGLPDLMSRNIHVNQQDLRDIFRRPSLHLHCLERSVREILVHTPKGHEDEILLPRVIHTIQDLARACVSNAQDTKESVLARFSSNLIWKDGIEVDINLQDKERRIITSGYLDLVVELEQGLQRRTGVTMTLLDNYVVVTEQVEKQGITSDRVTLQPIPIELVDLTFWDREVAITQREERFPSFPFTIRRQGRTPQEFHTFVTKSETDRSQWYQALQSTLRSRLVYTSDTKSYQTKLLRQDLLTNRTNSFMRGATNSAIFEYQGSQYCVVAGAGPPAGLWIWPRQRLRSPYVMPLDNVTQCAVLHKLGLLLVLTDKRLLAYHLYDVTFAQVVDGNRITPPSHKVDPTNPIVRFFRIGTHNGSPLLVLSTTRKQRANVFRVLEPSLGNPTKAKSISFFASKGGLFQLQGEFALDGPPAHDAKFLKTSLAIFGASGFQIVNITDLRNARGTIIPLCDQGAHAFGELSKRCCSSHATGIARIGDEFLLCYPDFGVYIDLQGHIRRGPIPWESTNIQTLLLHDQFIVLVSPQVVEVRLALSGKLVQLITGVGIRCLLSCEDGAKDDPIHLAMDRLSEEGRSRPGLGVSEAIFELLPSTS